MVDLTLLDVARVVNATAVQCLKEAKRIDGVSIDSRQIDPNNLFVPTIGERVNGHNYVVSSIQKGAIASLWQNDQPNAPVEVPLIFVDNTVEALQKLAKAYRDTLTTTFIGITGSTGKTSTKDIVSSICSIGYITQKTQGNRNNEIGLPLTILQLERTTQVAVMEMGISHPNDMSLLSQIVQPHVAIMTSICEAHVDTMGTVENIVAEKFRITECLKPDGMLLYNGDNSYLSEFMSKTRIPQKTFSYGFGNNSNVKILDYKISTRGLTFVTNLYNQREFFLPLLGKHQVLNAAAALLVASSLSLEANEVQEGLNRIELTSNRSEIKRVQQAVVIDDTYNANPDSMLAALEMLSNYPVVLPKIAILGDMYGLGHLVEGLHSKIGIKHDYRGISELWVVGNYAQLIANEVEIRKLPVVVKRFRNKEELYFQMNMQVKQACLILIKASRAVALDTVVSELIGEAV